MTPRELEEYRELRATIRERGTTRVWVFLAGLVAWAALTIATAALASLPVATLLPLLVLAAAFEAVFALHIGVERIGRYVQVYLEDGAGWEHAAMAFGRPLTGGRTDPLFSAFFLVAAILNFVPALFATPLQPTEWSVLGVAHLFVIARIVFARVVSARQRAADLQRFQELKRSSHSA